jgi:hypothetical protein
MIVSISLKDDEVVREALMSAAEQAPFAASLGINKTLYAAQKEQRARLPERFTFRSGSSASLFSRAVSVEATTKKNLSGGVEMKTPGGGSVGWRSGDRLASMFYRHEVGGSRISTALYRAGNQLVSEGFFIPAEGLRGPSKPVPRSLYPKAIGVALRRQVEGGEGFASTVKKKSKRRTHTRSYFVIPGVGIFQREHHAEHTEVDSVWFFHHRVTIKPRLRFIETVQRVVIEQLPTHVEAAVRRAIATAR